MAHRRLTLAEQFAQGPHVILVALAEVIENLQSRGVGQELEQPHEILGLVCGERLRRSGRLNLLIMWRGALIENECHLEPRLKRLQTSPSTAFRAPRQRGTARRPFRYSQNRHGLLEKT